MQTSEKMPCAREERCPGYYEVRIPAFFALNADRSLSFSPLGEGTGMGGVVTDCTECGMPAPRVLLQGLGEAVHALETKLKEVLT
ncbi:hypothetical protein ACFWNT_45505 [Streptomyces sp. NPDC058409]|uniref:hypothetical protein n=1 Tax=Streptomyces sp. NPDC058409 TaxID=3346484 RepID=UPI0036639EF9